jgi:hypothetical protein
MVPQARARRSRSDVVLMVKNRNQDWTRMAKRCAFICRWPTLLALVVGSICAATPQSPQVGFFPHLHAGQVLTYQISYHSDKHVKAQSSVVIATPDNSAKVDVNALLRLEVLGVQTQSDRAIIHARTSFEGANNDSQSKDPGSDSAGPSTPGAKFVEFTILPDGRLDKITGLDEIASDQQQAWQEWASRFLLAAEFRTRAHRVAQKWNSEEAENAPSPIAGLRWIRESTYVRDEPCSATVLTPEGGATQSDAQPETCAVILTSAALRQTSKANNATPEDFKLHELRTTGSAHGSNRIITDISLKTGLVIRATEEATQQMSLTVAKADGSNRVHYAVNAKSRSEVVLVTRVAADATNAR